MQCGHDYLVIILGHMMTQQKLTQTYSSHANINPVSCLSAVLCCLQVLVDRVGVQEELNCFLTKPTATNSSLGLKVYVLRSSGICLLGPT